MNMIVILLTTVLSVPPDNLIIPSTLSDIYINKNVALCIPILLVAY